MFSFLSSSSAPSVPATSSPTRDASLAVPEAAPEESAEGVAVDEGTQDSQLISGQVKFFNDQNMYGFIRRLDNGEDVFVHINDLEAKNCPAPTLFTGEYVSFYISSNGLNADGSPRFKAVHVQGIDRGSLMCDHGEIVFRSYSRYGFGDQNNNSGVRIQQ